MGLASHNEQGFVLTILVILMAPEFLVGGRYVFYTSGRRKLKENLLKYLDLPSAEISADGFVVGDFRRN